jgi:signal transduction histidine kinase
LVATGATLSLAGLASLVVRFRRASGVVRRQVASFVAAFAVAVAFQPARMRVQRVVDRLLLPERLDPQQLEIELAGVVRRAAGPGQALQDAVRLLQERLHARWVAVVPSGHREPVAATGELGADATALPLLQHGTELGRLELVARDAAGETLVHNPAVHAAVAGPVTAALHAWTLASDLERRRESIVAAREEERRRLRRDLHDGLGPQLAAITMTLDTARRALGTDRAERAGELLVTAIEQSHTAVEDVRTVVAGLRPPALDELGLEGALRSAGPGVLVDHDASTRITIRSETGLGALPAATEVAAYRIAQEAMTNAVRHSAAQHIEVTLTHDSSGLRVVVADDGTGFNPTEVIGGVGLHSMRERAAELGGSFTVRSVAVRGSCIEVVLPDRRSEA